MYYILFRAQRGKQQYKIAVSLRAVVHDPVVSLTASRCGMYLHALSHGHLGPPSMLPKFKQNLAEINKKSFDV